MEEMQWLNFWLCIVSFMKMWRLIFKTFGLFLKMLWQVQNVSARSRVFKRNLKILPVLGIWYCIQTMWLKNIIAIRLALRIRYPFPVYRYATAVDVPVRYPAVLVCPLSSVRQLVRIMAAPLAAPRARKAIYLFESSKSPRSITGQHSPPPPPNPAWLTVGKS